MVNQYSEIFECFFCLENFNCRTLVSKSETQLISEIADSIKVKIVLVNVVIILTVILMFFPESMYPKRLPDLLSSRRVFY